MKINKNIILTGRDIIKGQVTKTNLNSNSFLEATPWQMVELDEKTQDWKEWNADYFEWIGLTQVRKNSRKIIKNRRLASGILDMEDYMIPETGAIAQLQNWTLPEETENSLNKFHPLIPPFLKVLDGEFLKRNLRVYVSCIDRNTEDEKLEYKKTQVDETMTKLLTSQKQEALQKMGLVPIDESEMEGASQEEMQQAQQQNQQYYSEMDAVKGLAEAQQKYKTYRHIFEQFGQHVINKSYDKFRMAELEREAFMETLCNSGEYWHIDLGEADFKVEFLDAANIFKHQSHNIKYSSSGDYFGWFQNVSAGDIINMIGKRLSKEQFDNLKGTLESYNSVLQNGSTGSIVAHEQGWPGAYYDTSKKYPDGKTNIPMAQYWQGENLNAIVNANNFKNQSSASIASLFGNTSNTFEQPKMFRMLRLYWRSQRKIGWLVKKDKTGQVVFQDWIDENFMVSIPPIYDNTITNEKSKDNLVYGEHIDWEWVNEWRHIIKINNNIENGFWKNQNTYGFEPIYLDGDPVKFQFSGKADNPYEVYPPIEGVEFKMKQIRPISIVDLLAPSQIDYNIARNKIPNIMFQDNGLVLAVAKSQFSNNTPGVQGEESPREAMLRGMREDKIFEYTPPDKDILMTYGNALPVKPEILNYSRIKEALDYLALAEAIKQNASQLIGISAPRMAQSKASMTATGVQNDINYSETQTEPYFHQHIVEFMPRVYQKILEAAQYYCTLHESARVAYQTTAEENIFLEVENLERLPRNYNIKCTSDIKESVIKEKLERLFLENNTTDASLLELASGVTTESPAEILEILRQAQVKREKLEQQKYEQEIQQSQAERDAAAELQRQLFEHESTEKELDRQSQEEVARIRAMGGLQSDADMSGELDAKENLDAHQANQQMQNTQSNFREKLAFDKQKHRDNTNLSKEQLLAKSVIEQKKLAIALANQQKNDDKKLNRKIAKKQGVS